MKGGDCSSAEPVIRKAFGCAADLAGVIAAKARRARHPAQSTILSAQAPAPLVFLMLGGHAQSFALSIDARLVVIEDFREGAIFGESGLISAEAAQVDVIAVTASETGQFRTDVFIGLIENYPSVALAVSRQLSQRLVAATRRMVAVTTLSAPGRIHAELYRQALASGSWTLSPPPVLAEFARLVQTTRETVSRAISQLEKRGVIRRTGESLIVIAPHRLEELIY